MTIIVIVCNKCGAEWRPPLQYKFLNTATLRIMARSSGWVYSHKQDICINCKFKKKNGQPIKQYARRNNKK